MTTARTPVLVRDGRRFIDEETIMQLISDVDPVLVVTLDQFVRQWCWEKVVPIKEIGDEGADDLGLSLPWGCGA